MRLSLFLAPMLVGCVAAEVYETELGPLRVTIDDENAFYSGGVVIGGQAVEPSPIFGSLVVTTPDGQDLPYSLENRDAAMSALAAYCLETTGSDETRDFTYQNSRWVGLCR